MKRFPTLLLYPIFGALFGMGIAYTQQNWQQNDLVYRWHEPPTILNSVTFYPDSSGLEIVYTKDASIGVIYDNFKENQNYNYSKTVWKEIYTIVNGKLVKIKRVDGIFKEQQIIPEQIIFEEK